MSTAFKSLYFLFRIKYDICFGRSDLFSSYMEKTIKITLKSINLVGKPMFLGRGRMLYFRICH